MAKKRSAKRSSQTTRAKRAQKRAVAQDAANPVEELFAAYYRASRRGRAAYAQADAALDQLLEIGATAGTSYTLPGTARTPPVELTLVDQFAERNSVWTGSSCKRFKIQSQEVKPQDRK